MDPARDVTLRPFLMHGGSMTSLRAVIEYGKRPGKQPGLS
jgi:cytochrome c peroxidase